MQKNEELKRLNFLILTDFSKEAYSTLKYAISLVKQMKGNIHLFHVVDSGKIGQSENPLIVQQKLDEEGNKVKEKLKSIIEIIVTENISATYDYSFGNKISRIKDQIEFYNPDVTIIGRGKPKFYYKEKVTNYLINEYKGCVLIACNDIPFSSKTKISLACNKQTLGKYNLNILYDLHNSVTSSLSIINVLKDSKQNEEIKIMNSVADFKKEKDKLRFEFSINLNIVDGLIDYIIQKRVELICIGRSDSNYWILNRFFRKKSISIDIINKVNVPLLILEKK